MGKFRLVNGFTFYCYSINLFVLINMSLQVFSTNLTRGQFLSNQLNKAIVCLNSKYGSWLSMLVSITSFSTSMAILVVLFSGNEDRKSRCICR